MRRLKQSVFATRIMQLLLATFIVSGATVGLTACDDDGGAENVGESIDEGIEEAGDEIDDAS